jgi:hypothetical protein
VVGVGTAVHTGVPGFCIFLDDVDGRPGVYLWSFIISGRCYPAQARSLGAYSAVAAGTLSFDLHEVPDCSSSSCVLVVGRLDALKLHLVCSPLLLAASSGQQFEISVACPCHRAYGEGRLSRREYPILIPHCARKGR